MELCLSTPTGRPTIAVLGTWDPFTDSDRRAIDELTSYARRRDWASLAILIDPAPTSYIGREPDWPVYDDVAARTHLLHDAGADVVGTLHFGLDDLGKGPRDFFDLLCRPEVHLEEFWLRNGQRMGRGKEGTGLAIVLEVRRRGVRLRNLELGESDLNAEVREHLRAGRVGVAAGLVGRAPTVRRPVDGRVQLAWPAGRYHACARPTPARTVDYSRTIAVDLERRGDASTSTFAWPDPAIEWMSFVQGPGDTTKRALPLPASARAAGAFDAEVARAHGAGA